MRDIPINHQILALASQQLDAGRFFPWLRPFSPSIIKEKRKCFRRTAFKRIERLPDPAGPPAIHGGKMHAQLEDYVLRGKMPTHIDARAARVHAPRPLSALAEATIRWQHVGDPWSYLGIMDFSAKLLSKAEMKTSAFFEPGDTIVIGDYKFTGNMKYALSELNGLLVDPETLEPDPQSSMYADYYFHHGYEDIHGKWIYTETKHAAGKTPRTNPVWVHFRKDRVEEAMCGVRKDAAEIYHLYQIRPKANEVPFDKSACYAYGQPCPYISRCTRPLSMFDSTDTETDGEDMPGFADALKNSFPGEDDDDLPPIPDDELPDVPEDDEPDVPSELEAEGGMSEEEQQELIAEEIKKGRVEKGFVNAPEGADTVAQTPEEHFERFGDPVAPKAPKEPSRRFTKKDRPALLAKAIELGACDAATTVTASGLAKLLRGKNFDPASLFADVEEAPDLREDLGEFVDTTAEDVTDLPDVPEEAEFDQDGMPMNQAAHDEFLKDHPEEFGAEKRQELIDDGLLTPAREPEAASKGFSGENGSRAATPAEIAEMNKAIRRTEALSARAARTEVSNVGPTVVSSDGSFVFLDGYGPERIVLSVASASTLLRVLRAELEHIVSGRISFDEV